MNTAMAMSIITMGTIMATIIIRTPMATMGTTTITTATMSTSTGTATARPW